MLVPEEEFEAQMAGTLSPEAVADYFAHAPLAGISPYVDPVYLEDIAAPEPDVRIGHMCIDNPCMVRSYILVCVGEVTDVPVTVLERSAMCFHCAEGRQFATPCAIRSTTYPSLCLKQENINNSQQLGHVCFI
jgi:hypothetical protein